MIKLPVTDTKLGGILTISADLPFGSPVGYAQIDVVRAPSIAVTDPSGLRVGVLESGLASAYVLANGVWSRIESANVAGANHISIKRIDIFIWEVSVSSGTDAARNVKWHLDFQSDMLTVPLNEESLTAERNDSVQVNIYANGTADIANLDIRAEKNVW